MGDLTTTVLDALGILTVAAGVTGGTWPALGAWALCIGGAVLLAASYAVARMATRAELAAIKAERTGV